MYVYVRTRSNPNTPDPERGDDSVTAQEPICRISSSLVWPFVELALQHRCDAFITRCHAVLNLDPLQLEHADARIPLQALAPLLTELVATLGTRDVGLVVAQQTATQHVGLAEYLARSKDTLGAAMTSSIRYAYLLCDGARRSIAIHDDSAHLRFSIDDVVSIHDAAYEFALALLLMCARRITQLPDLRPTEVHFMHQQPRNVALHERLFRCRLRFDMPVSALVFPTRLMDLPLPGAEPALSRLLDQHAVLTLGGLPTTKLTSPQVRELLAAEIGVRRPTARRVAQTLGVSTRTLARRLDQEHTSFKLLFDQARRDHAVQALRESNQAIKEIAKRLGFSSSQSFHRAFRRWTGTTAMSFRGGAKRRSCPDIARMADFITEL
jgi:AraC-like DNA-binding protein